jgi:hypothetical protein
MTSILTREDVVRRIAAECTFIDERGAVGFSPETGRRDRAPVRRTIPATAPTKAKPPAKAAAAAVIAAAQFWEQVKKASVVGYFRLQRPAGNAGSINSGSSPSAPARGTSDRVGLR